MPYYSLLCISISVYYFLVVIDPCSNILGVSIFSYNLAFLVVTVREYRKLGI